MEMVIISILQIRKWRLGEVKCIPQGRTAQTKFEPKPNSKVAKLELFDWTFNSILSPHSHLGGMFGDPGPTCPSRAHTAWGVHYLDRECLLYVVLDSIAHNLDLHIHFAYLKWEKHKGHHLGGVGGHDHHLAGWGSGL